MFSALAFGMLRDIIILPLLSQVVRTKNRYSIFKVQKIYIVSYSW